MLVLDDVTFAWPANPHYRFSMEAEAGEITAIGGASGSGKSTLLDLVAGFLEPLSGTIRVDGNTVNGLPPEQRPVSILFQSETLFEHLSAARNVGLGLRRPDHARIAAALAEVGLPDIGSTSAPAPCRAARSSASPSPGRCCATSRCCCSMNPSRRSTTKPAPRRAALSSR